MLNNDLSIDYSIYMASYENVQEIFSFLGRNQATCLYNKDYFYNSLSKTEIEEGLKDPHDYKILITRLRAESDENMIGCSISYDLRKKKPLWLSKMAITPDIKHFLDTENILYNQNIIVKKENNEASLILLNALIREAKNRNYNYILCHIAMEPLLNNFTKKMHENLGFEIIGVLNENQQFFGLYKMVLNESG